MAEMSSRKRTLKVVHDSRSINEEGETCKEPEDTQRAMRHCLFHTELIFSHDSQCHNELLVWKNLAHCGWCPP